METAQSIWERSFIGGRVKFTEAHFNENHRFSIGRELGGQRYYLAIPVSNRLVDYEEYYEISREAHDGYPANELELAAFAEQCRRRLNDHLLLISPGLDRGSAS